MCGMLNSPATLPSILFGEQHTSYKHVSNLWEKLTCFELVAVAGIAGKFVRCASSNMCSTACSPFGSVVKCDTSVVRAGHALHSVVFSRLWIGKHMQAGARSRHSVQNALSGAATSPETLGVPGALEVGAL